MQFSANLAELLPALIAAKGEFPAIVKDKLNTFLSKDGKIVKYADLAGVIEATEPILLKHGLVICQSPVSDAHGVGTESVLFHTSGQFVAGNPFTVPLSTANAQVGVAAVTYTRRASYSALLCVAAEDDDGNTASGNTPAAKKASSSKSEQPKSQRSTATAEKGAPEPETNSKAAGVDKNANTAEAPAEKYEATDADLPASLQGGDMPSEEEKAKFLERGKLLVKNLTVAGLKPSRGVTVAQKLERFFKKSAGTEKINDISKLQWQTIFGMIDSYQSKPDGMKEFIKIIEKEYEK